uniref:Hyaluronan mediated motility receptor-like isoform X1 n=1 Tax=Crassostrea virginica TaxID=6565 RepID=A0A8B8DFK6_CRAVI|nr:hyaluronan mediated motility receptor-like isoform X1 [Crassostrea virginica]XP_022326918.1 hyaluronan mediated motility receptor-like isoform X1 [Crassostrea virginica]XP_022326919.1 hyaluronan mediated motility receptor-like isoform X1 [Crassostrea virginica]
MTVNSQRLTEVQDRLEKLLTDKKCLNSKVTSDAFTGFRTAVGKVKAGQTADLLSSLKKLENCLKSEGSYKNVKVGFETAKADVNEVLGTPESPTRAKVTPKPSLYAGKLDSKHSNPRAVTVTLSNSYARQRMRANGPGYQRPTIEPDAPPAIRTRKPPVEIKGSQAKNAGPEEMSSLNKTISRLFNHLEINKLAKESDSKPAAARQRNHRRVPSPHRRHKREDHDVRELLDKLQMFEDELQRRKEKQNEEILSLQAQIQKYKLQATDQSKEIERLRGVHSITNKAKGRHVGMIEERYQEEKKDFETRLKELENNLKRKYESEMQEKDSSENTLRIDFNKLKKEIQKIGGLTSSGKTAKRARYRAESEPYDIAELMTTLDSVARDLQSQQTKAKGSEEDASVWKSNYMELDKEINRFCQDMSSSSKTSPKKLSTPRSGSNPVSAIQALLAETKSQVLARLKQIEEKDRALYEQDQQIRRLRESGSLLAQLVGEIEASFKELPPSTDLSQNTLSARSSSGLRSIDMLKHIRLYIHESFSESTGKDKTVKDLENDIAALENRIKSLDTEVTPTYTDDNIHGDTPTPTRQLSIVSQTHEGVSESCGQLLKKLDIVQIGFVQIQTQNKQMVNEINSLKKVKESLNKTKNDLEGICKILGVSLKEVDATNISHVVRTCKSGAEGKVKEVDIKEGIIQRTRSELEKLREDIHNLWEYVTSNEDSATTKSPEGDKSTRNTPNPKTPDPKQVAAVKGKAPKTPSTKEQLEMILRQFNKLKGENSTLYSTLKEKDVTVIDAESKLKVERTHLAQQVKERDDKLAQALIECESLKADLAKVTSEKKSAEENADKEKSSLSQLKAQLLELEDEFTKVKDTYEARVNDLQKKLQESLEETGKLDKDKQNLMTRLSAMASAQLTDGNPAITDLSDVNRPTKIAEKFSELYDNEWTDAFEALTSQYHMSEKEAVDTLLRILKDCYNFGKVAASGQLSELHKVLLMLHTAGRTRETAVLSSVKKLTKEELKAIKEIRKACAVHAVKAVQKFFSDTPDGRTALSDSQQSSCACFITRAVELCWLMNVQDPPLVVTWSVKPGVICDNTRYKQFTHSGQFVEFLVWPPLYLFKDGHLLSKGVVQCI